MRCRFTFPLARFKRDTRGATAIEFAFILPVMVWMLCGTLEFATWYYADFVLEGSVIQSSRLAKTGYSEQGTTGVTRENMILNMIRNQAFVLMDPSKITITTKVYKSIQNVAQPEPFTDSNHNGSYNVGEPFDDVNGNGQWDADMGTAGMGGAEDIVLYTVTYPWKIMTPFLSKVIGNSQGLRPITSSVIVKNEPWEKITYGG